MLRSREVISAAAITLALAFWAPYNHGEPVCPDGVQVEMFQPGQGPNMGASGYAELGNGCSIHLSTDLLEQPARVQCAAVAHELGHAFFGLLDNATPGNVMNNTAFLVVPGKCDPPPSARCGAFQAMRWSQRGSSHWPSRCQRYR